MHQRDYRDVAGGGLLAALGLAVAAYAFGRLELGSLTRIGPGMFPAGLGIVLAVLGAIIAIPAAFRPGSPVEVPWRQGLAVLGGVLAFGIAVSSFGLVPGVVALTAAASLSEAGARPARIALMSAVLSAMAYLIFAVGLGLALEPFRWPFP